MEPSASVGSYVHWVLLAAFFPLELMPLKIESANIRQLLVLRRAGPLCDRVERGLALKLLLRGVMGTVMALPIVLYFISRYIRMAARLEELQDLLRQ